MIILIGQIVNTITTCVTMSRVVTTNNYVLIMRTVSRNVDLPVKINVVSVLIAST